MRGVQEWFAQQEINAQDPAQPQYINSKDGLPEWNPLFKWRDPFSDARKQELMEGVGCIAALIYQRDMRGCGIGWVFCEQPGYHYGKVVLGPGLTVSSEGSFKVFYEDPWDEVRCSWDHLMGDGALGRFLRHGYPGGFGDSMNRVAQAVAEQNDDWVPPMFYLTGPEYPDEA